MSIKDNINKGFTIGDVTTTNYDSEAKIKVKAYYELDMLERGKVLELAGQVDVELAKRDIKIEKLEEKIDNNGSDGNTETGMYTYYPPEKGGYYTLYKKVILKSEILEKCNLSLDKYNALSGGAKANADNTLLASGFELPVTLEKVKSFINGLLTGYGEINLMYICRLFSECLELKTDLDIEYYKSPTKTVYRSDESEYYRLNLPNLTVYISENNKVVISETEGYGIWLKSDRLNQVSYKGISPVKVYWEVKVNGDYELTIALREGNTSNYILKTNEKAQVSESLPVNSRYLSPLNEFNYNTIYCDNTGLDKIPVNIGWYLSEIPIEKYWYINIEHIRGSQTSMLEVEIALKETKTITAVSEDLELELFRNLNISGEKEIKLNGEIKAQLSNSKLIIKVPKGESIELKQGVSYKCKEIFLNTMR